MTSSPSAISLKILLISVSIISVAMSVRVSVPLIHSFAVTELPVIWSVIISWLKPPYLYVIINVIIFIIAASTRFQHTNNEENNITHVHVGPPNDVQPLDLTMSEILPVSYDAVEHVVVEPPPPFDVVKDVEMVSDHHESEEVVMSGDTWRPLTSVVDASLPEMKVKEKRLVGSRFGHNRKLPLKPNPEGARALRVLKPKKHETMESTWKMITEGRHMPLTRHLNKSDTFQNRNETSNVTNKNSVKKSETFKDRTNYENENQHLSPSSSSNLSPATSGKLKKEGSLGQDELNRRVEAFIKKFNDDMRLQRQESLNQYMEMVNRGAH